MGPLLLLEVSDGERWGERLPVDGLVVGEEPAHLPHCATTQVVPCTTLKLTIFASINGVVIGESILMQQLVRRWMAQNRTVEVVSIKIAAVTQSDPKWRLLFPIR
jgi:hypothetical protein